MAEYGREVLIPLVQIKLGKWHDLDDDDDMF